MRRSRKATVLAFVVFSVAACRIGETNRETVTIPARMASETTTCDSPFTTPDLATLEACGDGKGHCYEGKKSPIGNLPACAGANVCVPDKVLTSGGKKLKACTFFVGNKPGACVSLLIQDIEAHKNELKQDVCDPDERCAPCIDPTNDQDTGLCADMGVHEKPCIGGEGQVADLCCHGSGVCLNREGIPEDSRGDLDRETCAEGQLCGPRSLVDGAPVKCDIAGISGVCLDLCFAKMLQSTAPVTRAGCGPTEVCLPCIIGSTQGMPGCD